jgi:undecaprenyl-diphosphatase
MNGQAELAKVQTPRPGNTHRLRLLTAIACVSLAPFAGLTVLVTTHHTGGFDADAFRIANQLRVPWLDTAARAITTLGLIAVVGPVVVLVGVWLAARGRVARAASLVGGAALAWLSVWIVKSIVDRPRPPAPLVHTSGQSYPSAHAANSVGWLALALALAALLPAGAWRIAAIAAGGLLAVLVGLSRIYLRAHYASDVLGGEALAVTMYALAALVALTCRAHGEARLHLGSLSRRQHPHLD